MKTKIKASHIIAFDGAKHVHLRDGEVVYAGDTIEFVGRAYHGEVDAEIDATGKLVVPGMISIHGHVTDAPFNKSYLEEIVVNRNLSSELYEHLLVIWPTPEEARAGARASILEMLRHGCTTFLDMTPDYPAYGVSGDLTIPELVAGAVGELGARACVVPTYRSGIWGTRDGTSVTYKWLPDKGRDALQKNVSFIEKYHGAYEGRLTSMLGPAQADTCTEALLRETAAAAADLGVGITIHAAQSLKEFEVIMERHGKTPIRFLNDLGILGPRTIIAHAIYVTGHSKLPEYPGDEDLRLLAATGTSVAHSPQVAGTKGTFLESFNKYRSYGINVGIATDTVPLDILNEMRLAGICCRATERSARACGAVDVFDAATLGSAKALGRDDLGRIATGAKADLVIVDLETPRMSPVRDVLKNFVYHATAREIETVIVNGRTVIKHGLPASPIDERALSRELQEATESLWARIAKLHYAGKSIDDLAPQLLDEWSGAETRSEERGR